MENLEIRILLQLIFNSICGYRILGYILQISLSKIKSGIENSSSYARYPWMILALEVTKLFDQSLMVHNDFLYVAKNILKKLR